jgi:hypothetical protein
LDDNKTNLFSCGKLFFTKQIKEMDYNLGEFITLKNMLIRFEWEIKEVGNAKVTYATGSSNEGCTLGYCMGSGKMELPYQ